MPDRSCIIATSSALRSGECNRNSNPTSVMRSSETFWKKSNTGKSLCLPGQMEAITYPRLGNEIFWIGWVLLDFLAQLIDEHSQILHFISIVWSPHRLQQFRMRNRNIGVRHKVLQKVEFFRRQPGLTISHNNTPQVEIDFDVVESNNLHLAGELR